MPEIIFRMTPNRAAPHPEMVNAASEVLRKGTIPAAGGYGLVTVADSEKRKAAES
jgi:hypothetical protein